MDGMVGVPLPRFWVSPSTQARAFYLLTVVCLILVYAILLRGWSILPSGERCTQSAPTRTAPPQSASMSTCTNGSPSSYLDGCWVSRARLMVFLKAGTTPMSLHWIESGNVLIMVIFGGMGTLLGPIIGVDRHLFSCAMSSRHASRLGSSCSGWSSCWSCSPFPDGLVGILNRLMDLAMAGSLSSRPVEVVRRISARWTVWTWRSCQGKCTRSSAPTARARRRLSTASPASFAPDGGEVMLDGRDVDRLADRIALSRPAWPGRFRSPRSSAS